MLGFSSSSFLYQPVSHRLYLLDVNHPPNDYWPTDLGFKDTIRLGRGEKNSREARGPDYVRCFLSNPPFLSLSAGQLSTAPRGGPAGSLVDRNAIQVPKSPILFLLMRNVSFPLFINDVGRLVQGEIRMCIRPIEKERERDGVIVLLLLSDRPSLSCLSGRSEPSNSPTAKETSGNETLFFGSRAF